MRGISEFFCIGKGGGISKRVLWYNQPVAGWGMLRQLIGKQQNLL